MAELVRVVDNQLVRIADNHYQVVNISDPVLRVDFVERQGERGPPGPQGVPGDVGGSLPWTSITGKPKLEHMHDQTTASGTWLITHNMGRAPSVVVIDSGGNRWIGDERHISLNVLEISFTDPFAGKAYLN